jgi:outer membrane protein OmpA-like peptidoglycan-associated protein
MTNYAKLLLGTVGVLALCAGSAQAANFDGWYIGLEGGANWVEDWDHRQNFTSLGVVTSRLPATSSFDTGWTALASVGYGFNNWRLEVEGGYRHNDQDLLTAPPLGLTTTSGELATWSVMGNVLYDIPLGRRFSVTLGAGAGGANLDIDYVPAPGSPFEDDDWHFAYQGIAGLNYAIGSRTALFLNYRYFRVVDPEFDFRPPTNVFVDGDDMVNHTATIGLRFALSGQEEPPPPPPPPAPPAPPPPPPEVKHFIIFFGFNKCNITGEADSVLSQAAATAKSTGAASISIVGHTDTVGSDRYNQKLSLCRANAAKSNLAGKGIPASAITVSGKGETELMVQTGDNVKEPQNRRATVDLN